MVHFKTKHDHNDLTKSDPGKPEQQCFLLQQQQAIICDEYQGSY